MESCERSQIICSVGFSHLARFLRQELEEERLGGGRYPTTREFKDSAHRRPLSSPMHTAKPSRFCPMLSPPAAASSLFHCHHSPEILLPLSKMMITRASYLVFPGTTLSLSNIPNPGASMSFPRTSSFLSCRLSRHSIPSDLLSQRLPMRHMFWMGGHLASDPWSQLSLDTRSLNDPQIHRPLQLQN